MSRETELQEIDRVLEVLVTDKLWHTIGELAERANLPKRETAEITDFLAVHRFILLNKHGEKARIKKDVNRFLAEIQDEERAF